ncbi:hypothetical protein BST61_g6417 [Cercospora zeina]
MKSPVAVQSSKAIWDFSRDRSVADGLAFTAAWNSAMVQSDNELVATHSFSKVVRNALIVAVQVAETFRFVLRKLHFRKRNTHF